MFKRNVLFGSLKCSAIRAVFGAAVTVVLFAGADAAAQTECEREWLPGSAVPGMDSFARTAIVVDASRSQSGREEIYVGGLFSIAGDVFANGIAMWNGERWNALGSGVSDARGIDVSAITSLPNGDIVIGGKFDHAGGIPASRIARWDGARWHAFGAGANDSVRAAATLQDGRLVIGGAFTSIDGIAASGVAIWDGSTWSPLGGGVTMASGSPLAVTEVKALPDGRVLIGGFFDHAGGLPIAKVAIVDPATGTWSAVGGTTLPGFVYCLSVLPSGDIVAAGTQSVSPGSSVPFVVRSAPNGGSWQPFGDTSTLPAGDALIALASDAAGNVYIGGRLYRDSESTWGVYRSGGGTWALLGDNIGGFVDYIVPMQDGRVFAGGEAGRGIRELRNSAWQSLNTVESFHAWQMAQTVDGRVYSIASLEDSSGDELEIGLFERVLNQWRKIDAEFDQIPVRLKALRSGNLLAIGSFTRVGSVQAQKLARFDGVAWHAVGNELPGNVRDIAELSDGTLYAAVYQNLDNGDSPPNFFKLEAGQWVPAGGGGVDGVTPRESHWIATMKVLPNDDIIVGGRFTRAGAVPAASIARWDGAEWHAIGNGIASVNGLPVSVEAITTTPDGELYVGGYFHPFADPQLRSLVHFNTASQQWESLPGVRFTELGDSSVRMLYPFGERRLLVAGGFESVNNRKIDSIFVWDRDSHAVELLGDGLGLQPESVIVRPNGDVWAGGWFANAGDQVANGFAIWTCPCTADFDHDGIVTFEDFDAFVLAMERGEAVADLDHDGMITFSDFDDFVTAFTQGC